MIRLPLELVVHVLECLSYRDILKSKQVWNMWMPSSTENARLNHIYCQISKRFKSIINDSMSLGYRIQLGLNGLEDSDIHCTGPLSLSHRMSTLQEYLRSWDTLHFSPLTSVEFESGRAWDMHSNILSEGGSAALQLTRLPSPVRKVASATWILTFDSFGINNICDYVTDPAQDLLVLYEVVLSPT